MKYVIASNVEWHKGMVARLAKVTGSEFFCLERKEDLTLERLTAIAPRYIFFPHWSFLIPESIYASFECVIFHMTDVPFGRGGSPLQNLISRGIYETKLTALRCEKGIDTGPVYEKRPLCLHGAAEEIYIRAGIIIERMILFIVTQEPVPIPQEGESIVFKRRTPEEGNIGGLGELGQVYDFIRMLDAEGYPDAFVEVGNLRLEFQRASLKKSCILADVKITVKSL